MPLYNFL